MIRARWPHPRGHLAQAQSQRRAVPRLDEVHSQKARASRECDQPWRAVQMPRR